MCRRVSQARFTAASCTATWRLAGGATSWSAKRKWVVVMLASRFSRPARPAKQCTYIARPRAAAVAIAGPARMSVPVPKQAYIRDDRLRDMCRAMPCQRCGNHEGVTWAHSNQAQHGKGRSIKASDQFVAALCQECHAELDQGSSWTRAERIAVWTYAHNRTVATAIANGTWPDGVPIPAVATLV